MSWIVRNIGWVLIVSGLGTSSVLLMAADPRLAMQTIFGEVAEGPVAALIARSWGALVGASGLLLIYAAYHAETRLPILLYSIAGKLGFVVLVAVTPAFRSRLAAVLAAGDLAIVLLLGWYLIAR
ncbi:MAG TPA: hypothetical protein VGG10_16180 [Rhizomicrobium sp.]